MDFLHWKTVRNARQGSEKLLETMIARIVDVTLPGVDRNLVLSFMKPWLACRHYGDSGSSPKEAYRSSPRSVHACRQVAQGAI